MLSKVGYDCYIDDNFVDALAYADDIVFLAPTPAHVSLLAKRH